MPGGPVVAARHLGHAAVCTLNAQDQGGDVVLGAQAAEGDLRDLSRQAGFSRFRRAAQTPFNRVFEVRP